MRRPKRLTRLRKGPTPLLRQHGTFLRRVVTRPDLLQRAGLSQLRAIQEVLQNVKMGNIPIPPKLIKGTPRNQIGKGLSTLCCYKTGPLLAGNNQTGGFPLAALARYAIPIALSFLYDRITDRKYDLFRWNLHGGCPCLFPLTRMD